ncbi:hypothetical protein B5F76_12675 [Desulfovibrio sp. An276]|nr:hypothetical protein B5F76_12675 [Desulfovibrio sp. An276]
MVPCHISEQCITLFRHRSASLRVGNVYTKKGMALLDGLPALFSCLMQTKTCFPARIRERRRLIRRMDSRGKIVLPQCFGSGSCV